MFDTTIFHTKKIVTRKEEGWTLDINLLFGRYEFSMTDTAIGISEDDVPKLIPGLDPDSVHPGEVFTDIVDIDSPYQFESTFGTVLKDEATELLCDVYTERSWSLKVMNAKGNVEICGSVLSDNFIDTVMPTVSAMAPCWIELSYAEASFTEDWAVVRGEPHFVFSNIHDGLAPMSVGEVVSIIERFGNVSHFSNREEFVGNVTKQGNSLVLKVTDQCRRMGLEVGDEVNVTMSRDSPKRNTMLRAFYSRNWTPIDDPDAICHRNGCDLEKVRRFLDDFKVIGTVKSGMFKPGWYGSPYHHIFDHCSFLKTDSGANIIVSQPYSSGSLLEDAEEWAEMHGCTVEEHRDYSWHHPPETTLLVFRIDENPEWRIPKEVDD